jgi:hypothetical protein
MLIGLGDMWHSKLIERVGWAVAPYDREIT